MKKTPENDLGADAAAVESAGSIAPEAAIARHTPGQWTVHKSRGLNAYELRSGEAYLADIWGADTPVPNGVARGAVKANAQLIAAAPELYEALKAIVNFVDGDSSPVIEICGRHYDAARAALLKAEGK